MVPVRIVTLNMLSDLLRWEARREWLARELAALEPDLIALQEVNLRADTAGWLAEQLDFPHRFITPKTGREARREGLALLSRLPFEAEIPLDLQSQDRVAQIVRVRVEGSPLLLANVHLYWQPGDAPERMRQVERLLARLLAAAAGDPAVVCGDFNASPETLALSRMRLDFVSAYAQIHGREPEFTAPTPLPVSYSFNLRNVVLFLPEILRGLPALRLNGRYPLDYIFVDPRLPVRDCRLVLNRPAPGDERIYPSDHFGLLAEIDVS